MTVILLLPSPGVLAAFGQDVLHAGRRWRKICSFEEIPSTYNSSVRGGAMRIMSYTESRARYAEVHVAEVSVVLVGLLAGVEPGTP